MTALLRCTAATRRNNMLPLIQIILPMYSVCCGFGIIAAAGVLIPRVKKYGVKPVHAVQLCIFAVIGMVLGSKILFGLTRIGEIIADFSPAKLIGSFVNGGFVFYGGLFGALAAVKLYSAMRKFDSRQLFNMVVPCFLAFHALGRVGCFLSGCCYGIEFPFGFEMHTSPGVIRFPVQLAESLCDLLILAAVLIVEKKKGKQVDLLRVYMVSYAVCRFLLEFLRGDEIRGRFLCFSTSQWIALAVLAYYAVRALLGLRKKGEVKSL